MSNVNTAERRCPNENSPFCFRILSARKLRSRFHALVSKVVEELNCGESVRIEDTPNTDVQLVIRDGIDSMVVSNVPLMVDKC